MGEEGEPDAQAEAGQGERPGEGLYAGVDPDRVARVQDAHDDGAEGEEDAGGGDDVSLL